MMKNNVKKTKQELTEKGHETHTDERETKTDTGNTVKENTQE